MNHTVRSFVNPNYKGGHFDTLFFIGLEMTFIDFINALTEIITSNYWLTVDTLGVKMLLLSFQS